VLSSPNVKVVMSGSMRWMGHVACMEEKKSGYRGF
jgi:hypothetical protein